MEALEIPSIDEYLIVHNGEPVITLAAIDKLHGRPAGTAGRNMREHREWFEKGIHYYVATCDEIRRGFPHAVSPHSSGEIFLLAERGYFLATKPMGDPLSWRVAEMLAVAFAKLREILAGKTEQPALPAGLPDPNDNISLMEGWLEQAKQNRASQLALQASEAERAKLSEVVDVLTPKAEVYNKIADADGLHLVSEAAKVLGIGEFKLFEWMRDNGIVMKAGKTNLPYQVHLDAKRFRVIERTRKKKDGTDTLYQTMYVTGRGVVYLAKRLAEESVKPALMPTTMPAIIPTSESANGPHEVAGKDGHKSGVDTSSIKDKKGLR